MGDPTPPCPCLPQAFTVIDQNRDGIIDKEDLRDTFAAMGEPLIPPIKIQGCRVLGIQKPWVSALLAPPWASVRPDNKWVGGSEFMGRIHPWPQDPTPASPTLL